MRATPAVRPVRALRTSVSVARCAVVVIVMGLADGTRGIAAQVRVGGSVGFGLATSRQQGLFKWDFGAGSQDTDLLQVKLEASPAAGLRGFVRIDAPSGGFTDPPAMQLGEASLTYERSWGDHRRVDLRGFARQPQSLWLDNTLGAPVDPRLVGDDVLGLRVEARWHAVFATVLAADPQSQLASSNSSSTSSSGSSSGLPADPFTLLRLGIDLQHGPRIGTTWMRSTAHGTMPLDSLSQATDATLQYAAVDLTWEWSGVLFLCTLAGSRPADPAAAGSVEAATLRAPFGLLRELPDTAALQAEIRAASLGNERWGWIGFAPRLHVVGSGHLARLRGPDPSWGSPRRGFQRSGVEAWAQAAFWPLWVRQAFDRVDTFTDADRRVDRWLTEIEATLSTRWRGRTRWVSRDVEQAGGELHARDLLVDAWFEERGRRLRAQCGWIDIDEDNERQALALEYATPILGRWGAVARSSWTREAVRLRPSLFAELQYWHLPQFEFALGYGSDVFGAGADPVLEADAIAAGETRNVVRLHFRGWF